MTALLHLSAVTRIYEDGRGQRHALDGVDLTLSPGELVAIMGPSGSGKTTLLVVAAGIEAPDRGTVTIDGTPLRYSRADTARRLREQIGVVYQHRNLVRDLTAIENVALPLELMGVPTREAMARAKEQLAEVGMTDAGDVRPDELSGGERQRVAVARALIGDRRILLADEPTGALETTSAEHLMQVIRERTRDDRAAIVATHDQRLAAYADRVIYVKDGKIVGQVGAPVDADVRARA